MSLSRDLREFIQCLNSNEVEYLVVGALAVSWHGFPRYSADVDFPIRPNQANAVRVLRGELAGTCRAAGSAAMDARVFAPS